MGVGTVSNARCEDIGNRWRGAWLQDPQSATWSVPDISDDRPCVETQDMARSRHLSPLLHVQFHQIQEDERPGDLDNLTGRQRHHENIRLRYRPPASHTSDNASVPRTDPQFASSTEGWAAIIKSQLMPPSPILTPENDPFQRQSWPNNVETSTSHNITEVFGELPTTIGRTEGKQVQMTRRPDLLWQQIKKQGIINSDLQSRVHEARVMLRDKQITKSIVEDTLFQRIKEEYLGVSSRGKNSGSHRRTVLELLEACQAARDEYGVLDIGCTDLEDRLKSEEFALRRLEENFYPLISAIINPDSIQIPSQPAAGSVSARDSISEVLEGSELHPLTSLFLSTLGELDQLNERRDDLLEENYYLTEEQATHARVGVALSAENQATLASFATTERQILKEIAVASSKVDLLRQKCLKRGFVDRYDEPTADQSDETREFGSDQGIDAKDNTSEYVKYPVLLPRPGSRQDVQSFDLEHDEESEITKTNKRINHWLLEQLRTSPLQVFSLASTFQLIVGQTGANWQSLVICNWYTDGTLYNSPRAFSHSLSTIRSGGSLKTQADTTVDHSTAER
ncbi:hypothetical protein BJ875DRAFT_487513 [Amylocarpus encephaloides]|uniref:Uncharacterized protein n=1 Tax=Amylocarpus encephaloides TaxID=45428 RepID=A0A9P7YC11_9HELO|nr:hypothetical protein BJ875DRAFT_487513 [Amylocarpus encephaloides]